ncbi:outer membrane beta-barrel protein [Bdellovibrio reynosensis]|uniref:Outer membrane protein beta-barrel domain-containing protein n=1 Tax=Bdellovibrio reynosensis TaxID=2835041 RepID=A0ABY4CCQ6_9BACT|nr:hypothetical protein [Bdellovibrio reynosensis]UOF02752.1 hypothetical protein MNR06_07285 [Bdellovibrio reynosensis]
MKKVVALVLILFSVKAQAGMLLEVGATYLSDSLKTPTSTASSGYFWNLGVLFTYNKNVWGGWNFSGISTTATGTSTDTFTTLDTGPYLKWTFGKNNVFNLAGVYNLKSSATYSDGTTNETWSGTSLWLQFGVAPEIKDDLRVGASFNYYMATYTKKVVSSTESTTSNSKTWIFPMITVSKSW